MVFGDLHCVTADTRGKANTEKLLGEDVLKYKVAEGMAIVSRIALA
jgi:hypothetical protein